LNEFSPKRPRLLMRALEPRLMFDGAAAVTAAHAAPDAAAKALIPAVPPPVEVQAANPAADGGKKEVVFVDTSVAGYKTLEAAIKPGVAIEEIDGGQSGLAQVAVWAQSNSGYDSISLIGNGASGTLQLGTDSLTASGRIEAILATNGQDVAKGDLLVQLASPDLQYRLEDATRRVALLEYQVKAAAFDSGFLSQSQALREQLQSARAELRGLQAESERLAIRASFDGQVLDLAPNLTRGQWVMRKEQVGVLRSTDKLVVWAFLGDDQLRRVALGDRARFYPESTGALAFDGVVARIDPLPVKTLDDYAVASTFGGAIETHQEDRSLVPAASIYRLRIDVDAAAPQKPWSELRGIACISGSYESVLAGLWRSAAAVLIREMGM
jgi:multidrug efflux pump subunit AcrA (membrane-fusion protein)